MSEASSAQPSTSPATVATTATVELLSVGGLEMEGATSGPETGGRAILFLHGLGGDCRSWTAQLDSLGQQHRCAAWTMPGYGRSQAPERFDFSTLADLAAELLATLGWDSTVVVGHSMGGYVAQELALNHPDLVGGLVLAGTTAAFGKPGSDFNRDFLAARLAPLDDGKTPADLAAGIVDNLVAPGAGSDVRASAVESMSGISADAYRRSLEALVTWNAVDRLGELRGPTVCIAGELDGTAPPKAMQRLSDAIADSRLVVLPEVGHLFYAEAPEPFTTAVNGFLDELS